MIVLIALGILAGFLCLVLSPIVLVGVCIVRIFLKALFAASGRPTRVVLD